MGAHEHRPAQDHPREAGRGAGAGLRPGWREAVRACGRESRREPEVAAKRRSGGAADALDPDHAPVKGMNIDAMIAGREAEVRRARGVGRGPGEQRPLPGRGPDAPADSPWAACERDDGGRPDRPPRRTGGQVMAKQTRDRRCWASSTAGGQGRRHTSAAEAQAEAQAAHAEVARRRTPRRGARIGWGRGRRHQGVPRSGARARRGPDQARRARHSRRSGPAPPPPRSHAGTPPRPDRGPRAGDRAGDGQRSPEPSPHSSSRSRPKLSRPSAPRPPSTSPPAASTARRATCRHRTPWPR